MSEADTLSSVYQSGATDTSATINWSFSSAVVYVTVTVGTGPTAPTYTACGGVTDYGACGTGSYTVTGLTACSSQAITVKKCIYHGPGAACFPEAESQDVHLTVNSIAAGLSVSPPGRAAEPSAFADDNRWIYSGSSRIQATSSGAEITAVSDAQVSLLRGVVKDRDTGAAKSCATVSVTGHPEYGSTKTLWDGTYSLAVNGEQPVLLDIVGPGGGYLKVQRRANPRTHQYVWVDEARLVPQSTTVVSIDSAASADTARIAKGDIVGPDPGGTGDRQIAAYFQQGTIATIGSSTFTSFGIRSTEYTRTAGGQAAMPGPLPGSSAYTFAANFAVSGHEGEHVTFSNNVALYVNNFLSVPLGTSIPAGYWDETNGVWTAEGNGTAITIDSVDAMGVAMVSGLPTGVTLLAGESKALGTYPAGTKLWRFLVNHFSSYDWNFAWGVDPSAVAGAVSVFGDQTPKPTCTSGSIIECENQTLGERVPLRGTPFSLVYSSARQPGRVRLVRAVANVPSGVDLKRIEASAYVAGQELKAASVLPPFSSTQEFTFRWDGKDFLGRTLNGRQRARVHLGFVYPGTYSSVASFGAPASTTTTIPPTVTATGDSVRMEATLWRDVDVWVDAWDDSVQRLGGWSLSPVQYFDAESQTLYGGTGGSTYLETTDPDVSTIAGGNGATNLTSVPSGGTAADVFLPYDIRSVAQTLDGSLYVSIDGAGIWRVKRAATAAAGDWKNATIDRIANTTGSYVDTTGAAYLAADSDGSLLIADGKLRRYRDSDHVVSCVVPVVPADANCAVPGLSSNEPITLAPDGTIYLLDSSSGYKILRILPGTLKLETYLPSIAILGVTPSTIRAIAARKDGFIFLAAEGLGLWQVRPDGVVSKAAGGGSGPPTDGAVATAVAETAVGAAIAADGTVFYTSRFGTTVCAVKALVGDKIRVVAGGGACTEGTIDGAGRQAKVAEPRALTVASNGDIYFANLGANSSDNPSHRIRRISAALATNITSGGGRQVPSADGREVYVFDARGIIQKTIDGLTGHNRLVFGYDTTDTTKLVSITDVDGNLVSINRSGIGSDGNGTLIISVNGPTTLTTKLTIAGGALTSVAEPPGDATARTWTFSYGPGRLLSQLADPAANTSGGDGLLHHFYYGTNGELTLDQGFGEFSKSLSKSSTSDGWLVSVDTALHRTTTHEQHIDVTGAVTRKTTSPAGFSVSTIENPATAVTTVVYPSDTQTSVTSTLARDPRFGMTVPFAGTTVLKTAGDISDSSHEITVTTTRAVSPVGKTDPAEIDSFTQTASYPDPSGSTATWQTTYTSSPTHTTSTVSATTPLARTFTTVLDSHDRPTGLSIPGVPDIQLGYDTLGHVTVIQQGACGGAPSSPSAGPSCSTTPTLPATGCRKTQIAYDSRGFMQCMYDSIGRKFSVTARDSIGRPTELELPGKTADRLVDLTFEKERTVKVGVPIEKGTDDHLFSLDRDARALTYEPPMLSAGASGFLSSVDPDGNFDYFHPQLDYGIVSAVYSDLKGGRLSELWLGIDKDNIALDYDWSNGRLKKTNRISPTGDQVVYDTTFSGALPMVTEVNLSFGSVSGTATIKRTFDKLSRVSGRSIGSTGIESNVAVTYDRDGLLESVGSLAYSRTESGALRGDGALTGSTLATTTETFNRDAFGAVLGSSSLPGYEAKIGSQTLMKVVYSRDAVGRITDITETLPTSTSVPAALPLLTTTRHYSYRPEGWLEVYNAGGGSTDVTFGYDANGNRLEDASGAACDYDHDVLKGCGYTFDQNGYLIQRSDIAFQYDALGGLVSAGSVTYINDSQGRRVIRHEGTKTTAYLYELGGLLPIAEYAMDGTTLSIRRRFIYGARANVPEYMLAMEGSTLKTYRIISDHLGSPRLVVDTSLSGLAAVKQRIDYDAWGNVTVSVAATGFDKIPFGFAGGLYDPTVKLLRFGARDYDPAVGRWMARDPIGFRGGQTGLYVYANNNPVNLVDPSGLKIDVDGSDQFRLQLLYATLTNPDLLDIMSRLDAAPGTFVLHDLTGQSVSNHFSASVTGGLLGGDIYWNPLRSYALKDLSGNFVSPGTLLLHECAHADQYDLIRSNAVEQGIVDRYEKPAAALTGEGGRPFYTSPTDVVMSTQPQWDARSVFDFWLQHF